MYVSKSIAIRLLLLFAFLISTRAIAVNKNTVQMVKDEAVPNRLILKLKDNHGMTLNQANTAGPVPDYLSQNHGITALIPVFSSEQKTKSGSKKSSLDLIYYAYYSGSETPQQKARQLARDPHLVYAEPNYIHHIDEEPNDSLYYLQSLNYQVVSASEAWQEVKGSSGSVVIAIVDGGTDIRHRDLQNNIWINTGEIPDNQIDDDLNGFIDDVYGWNFANNSGDPTGFDNTLINRDHGTHTAGIASAVTNNITGVAGMAWNAQIMGINASDLLDDRTIIYGFEGIKYAAENGADVINCSWGRLGNFSQYEAEIIDYATSLGSVIVAAAGNNDSNFPHYPSSYKSVLAIAGTDASDIKYSASNFGEYVDIAAPAVNIYSTKHGDTYGYSTGTSMASPMAAGVVALVKTRHPDWLGVQAAEQVRVTADSLPAYGLDLGRGRLNAYRAVSELSPSIRISDYIYTDGNGNEIIEPGEQVELSVMLINFLAGAGDVHVTLSTSDPYITLQQSESQLAGLSTLEEKQITPPFIFTVAENAPGAHYVTFNLVIESANYRDVDWVTLSILPSFGDLDINNLGITVTNIGRIGHPNPDIPEEGIGFSYKSGTDLLFEGALISGTGVTTISNAARNATGGYDQDFAMTSDGNLVIITPGLEGDQESFGKYNDSQAGSPLPVEITQTTYAWTDSADQDYIIFLYTILNSGSVAYSNFYFGLFFDWDIDGGSYDSNVINYDPLRKLGYAYDTETGPDTYTGVVALSDADISFRAIINDENYPGNPWGIYDGFTDAEKWSAISGGISYTTAGPTDVSMVIGNGPLTIPAKSVQRLAYAMVAGDDSLQLMSAADSARAKWDQLIVTDMNEKRLKDLPTSFSLSQNFPNPFNPLTTINYELPITNYVELKIYNLLGQKVITLVAKEQNAGKYKVQWDASNFPSGVYYYQLVVGGFNEVKKMILIK